jgi:hypothetical protein
VATTNANSHAVSFIDARYPHKQNNEIQAGKKESREQKNLFECGIHPRSF